MASMRKLSFLIFVLGMSISFMIQTPEIISKGQKWPSTLLWPSSPWDSSSLSTTFSTPWTFFRSKNEKLQDVYEEEEGDGDGEGEYSSPPQPLEYDFYSDSCPQAQLIIQELVRGLSKLRSSVAPSLLRLVFHDCFIQGCDASVLLDAANGIDSEKDSPPNQGLRGFDIIDIIKSEIEKECPGIVSCSDILVLAAREAVIQAGGPFYPLQTGRRDSTDSFGAEATKDLPSPHSDLDETLAIFSSRGFDERETVSLLGAHSIGVIHCKFFQDRLYNFGGTNKPDLTMDTEFLNEMRSRCNNKTTKAAAAASPCSHGLESSTGKPSTFCSPSAAPSHSLNVPASSSPLSSPTRSAFLKGLLLSSPEEPATDMVYQGPGAEFGTSYYRRILGGKGILFTDQQLAASEETGIWVRAYASDSFLFRQDFALAMMKLSNHRVLTGSMGQVRLNCSKVA
ncbi:hypothetical protein Tsubulata_040938 [Turnera subulata]|uniref:peroxidase n=1 Tax=Turnera subulata TaxID=218843 RepID=A0A9Q0JJ47_9ROSI|nr:hypothetical protein Tsubulata_040938 [Turnera subulata]